MAPWPPMTLKAPPRTTRCSVGNPEPRNLKVPGLRRAYLRLSTVNSTLSKTVRLFRLPPPDDSGGSVPSGGPETRCPQDVSGGCRIPPAPARQDAECPLASLGPGAQRGL